MMTKPPNAPGQAIWKKYLTTAQGPYGYCWKELKELGMTHWKSQFDHSLPKVQKNARHVYMVTRLQAVCFDFQYGCHRRVSNEYSSIGYVSFLVNFSIWSGAMFLFIRSAPSPELQLKPDSNLNADLAESGSMMKLCSNECCPYSQSLVVKVRLFAHSLQLTVLSINDAIAHYQWVVWGKLIFCYKLLRSPIRG